MNLPPILPVGTQVVVEGEVGVVVRAPLDVTQSYRVRFVGGDEGVFKRGELVVLSRWKEGFRDSMAEGDLSKYVIYRVVVGSRAWGLAGEGSDTDVRGVYLPPAEVHWGLAGVPEQIENEERQECFWELEKFLVMALKANPNVLECLYSPLVEEMTEVGRELREMRGVFLSKLVYQTFNGYVLSQFKKMQQDVRNRGEVKWKHVMHLLRLLMSGARILRSGELDVVVTGADRDRLLAVKRGEVAMEEVEAWRLALHREMEEAWGSTLLPDRPDYEQVNNFLIRSRRGMVT